MIAVRGILSRLRKRSGLSPDRLRSTEIDITTLLELSVVRRHAHLAGISAEDALPVVIGHLAQQLTPTQRLIVDAELCLGLLRDQPPDGIDLTELYGSDLGERRNYVAERWRQLHEALGATDIPPTPTPRTLRGAPETAAFTALARRLTSGSVVDSARLAQLNQSDNDPTARQATVVVVGDAAFDQIFVVERYPVPGSSDWADLDQNPGGKGLNRVVALARLGLDARLIAAVGDDGNGSTILRYLRKEEVDTSLVSVRSGASTPMALVIMTLSGEYSSLAVKHDRIRLTETDIESPAITHALTESAAILLTFEQSNDVMIKVLSIAQAADPRPWVILNVSPPKLLGWKLQEHLGAVDYLIATAVELAGMWPDGSTDSAIRKLLGKGVGAVVVIDEAQCSVHTHDTQFAVPRTTGGPPGSLGAVAAFAAALTYRLVTQHRAADVADFTWATTAMAATRSNANNPPDSMPSVPEIDRAMPAAEDGSRPTSAR